MADRMFGGQSMVAPLRRVVVRRPADELNDVDPAQWGYAGIPHRDTAAAEHDSLVELLENDGVEVVRHDVPLPKHADAMFVHDPAFVTDSGSIAMRMGKDLRRGEEEPLVATLSAAGVPLHGAIEPPGIAEGGDLMWLRSDVLAVGQGFRTNAAALEQLTALLPDVDMVPVGLPYHTGPEHCLHLMSLISMVDDDLAVAHVPMLPVPFLSLLDSLGIAIVDVPASELATHATNVLAVAPRRCIMLAGNPITAGRLIAAGCEVRTYRGAEITLKAEGGATCLTRPLLRG